MYVDYNYSIIICNIHSSLFIINFTTCIDSLSTQEAPPLMPALTSGRYHIKWTQLADPPAPLYGVGVTVQDKKIYVIAGDSPVEDAKHQMHVYDIHTDQWGQLAPSGHYKGIPHIIGGKVVIIGGRLSATKKITNKVSTFDEDSQTWKSYYPNLLSVRSMPGVVSHLEHVIVAGGGLDDDTDHDDIEIFNWIENSHWRKVSIKLPVPMYGFKPTISDDHLLIVGYYGAERKCYNGAYKIPVANITASIDQQHNSDTPAKFKWTKLTAADHWCTAIVPSSSPPVVVGGENQTGTIPTADIKMYDNSNKSWKKIGSLSSARSYAAVAAVYNNAIIIIGGCTKGGSIANCKSSSVTMVELGQADLLH